MPCEFRKRLDFRWEFYYSKRMIQRRIRSAISVVFNFLVLLWSIEGIDYFMQGRLDQYGALRPRSEIGLAQIFSSPFLHGGLSHLVCNSVAFLMLAPLMLAEGSFWSVTALTILSSGLGIWLFSGTAALGFSGVLFGYAGFLMARGFYTRKPLAIAISLLVMTQLGGAVAWGLLPHQGISWAGHFWGFVGGLLAARFLPHKQS